MAEETLSGFFAPRLGALRRKAWLRRCAQNDRGREQCLDKAAKLQMQKSQPLATRQTGERCYQRECLFPCGNGSVQLRIFNSREQLLELWTGCVAGQNQIVSSKQRPGTDL